MVVDWLNKPDSAQPHRLMTCRMAQAFDPVPAEVGDHMLLISGLSPVPFHYSSGDLTQSLICARQTELPPQLCFQWLILSNYFF